MGLRIADCGLRIADVECRMWDCGLRIPVSRLQFPDSSFQSLPSVSSLRSVQSFRVYLRGDRFSGSNTFCSNPIYSQTLIEHGCYGFTQIKKIRANPFYLRHQRSKLFRVQRPSAFKGSRESQWFLVFSVPPW